MNKYFLLLTLFCGSLLLTPFILAAPKKNKTSTFKKVLNECFAEEFSTEKLNKLSQVYDVLDRKYQLSSATLLERETVFKEDEQLKKLKFGEDKWTLYKVSDNEILSPLDSGMRQKKPTIEATLSELLIHAKLQSDWTITKELRQGQRILLITRLNKEITALEYKIWDQKKSLECVKQERGDVCSCRGSK